MQLLSVVICLTILHTICEADKVIHTSNFYSIVASLRNLVVETHKLPLSPKWNNMNSNAAVLTKKRLITNNLDKDESINLTRLNIKPTYRHRLMKPRTLIVNPNTIRKNLNLHTHTGGYPHKQLESVELASTNIANELSKTGNGIQKRLSSQGFEESTTPINKDAPAGKYCRDELMFIKDKTKEHAKSHVHKDFEIATDSTYLQASRLERSINVIEEEKIATTTAYKYTAQDTRINNNLFFKNIHT